MQVKRETKRKTCSRTFAGQARLAAMLIGTTALSGFVALNTATAVAVPCAPTTVNIAADDTMTCVGLNDLGPAGITSVLSGSLFIDGTLINDFTNVSNNAAFGGMGSVTGDVHVNGTLIASPGDLSITGDLFLNDGSYLTVTLGGGTSTKVDVTGTATISDGANLMLTGDLTQDAIVTVLTATGGITGNFGGVTDEDGKLLHFATIASSNDVQFGETLIQLGVTEVVHQAATGITLDAHRGLLNTIHARIDHRYRDSAQRGSERKSYADFEERSSASLMSSQLDTSRSGFWPANFSETVEDDRFTPGFISDMIASDRSDAERMRRSLSALPRLQISTNYGGMWLEGFGMASEQTAISGVTGYKSSAAGFSIGLDSKAADNWAFGGLVGYGFSHADLNHNAGDVDGETVYTGVYMANISRTHYANLFLTTAITDFEAERAVTDGISSAIATDEFSGYMWDARLELGRTFILTEDDFIRPNLAIEYVSAFQDEYIDNGAGLVAGLTVDQHTTKMVRSEGQIDMLFGSQEMDDDGWSGRVFVGVAHEIFLDNGTTNAWIDGFRDPLTLATNQDHRTFGMLGGSISFAISQRMRTQISYQGEANTEFERHNVVAGFSVAW